MNQQSNDIPITMHEATPQADAVAPTKIHRTAQEMLDTLLNRSDTVTPAFLRLVGAELHRMDALLNSPELIDFPKGVQLEAAHQRERFDAGHDAGKTPEDWFWLIGYLSGRALAHHKEAERLQGVHAEAMRDAHPDAEVRIMEQVKHHREKAVHHTITAAAACANWHAAVLGLTNMRPGSDMPAMYQPLTQAAENHRENSACTPSK